jgi:hypothetical protein
VIRLELDASDDRVRQGLERQWTAAFRLRRALQSDAQHRCHAYWAAHHERATDPRALRDRLGLSREGIAVAAKNHIEASGWIRDHLTKAVGLHQADEAWQTVDRHLFADASGRRHGPPRIGSWWDFTRIPGRARSHTKTRPGWETWRLVGTLDGHLNAYRHPQLPTSVGSAAAGFPAGTSVLAQPAQLPVPNRPASGSWWDHDGAFAVVFTGLPGGDVVLPVRLPQGARQWAHLAHFLADPSVWHKIDLVRVRDRKAPGGWRYYAHLLTHQAGYQSAATRARRAEIPGNDAPGWMRTCPTLRWLPSPTGNPNSWSSIKSLALTSNRRLRRGPPTGPERARRHWIGLAATPTPTSTVPRRGSTRGRLAGPSADRRLDSSPIPAGRGIVAPMGCRCTLTATTGSRSAISAPEPNMLPRCGLPVGPNTPAPERSPRGSWPLRQHHHGGGLFDIHLGAVVGHANRVVQPWHAGGRPQTRMQGDRRHAASRWHPLHCAVPALPVRGADAENPRPAHP